MNKLLTSGQLYSYRPRRDKSLSITFITGEKSSPCLIWRFFRSTSMVYYPPVYQYPLHCNMLLKNNRQIKQYLSRLLHLQWMLNSDEAGVHVPGYRFCLISGHLSAGIRMPVRGQIIYLLCTVKSLPVSVRPSGTATANAPKASSAERPTSKTISAMSLISVLIFTVASLI